MSEEILGDSNGLSSIYTIAQISDLYTENLMETNHQDDNGAMETQMPYNPEHTDIKSEPMDSELQEPSDPKEPGTGAVELIPIVEHVKTELEQAGVGMSDEQEVLNPQKTPQTEDQQPLGDDVTVKIETEIETDERSELKTLEDQFREEINHTLNCRSAKPVKTEDPSDSIVDYDYPQFSMDSSDSGIHKTEIDTEISSEFMTYDGGQDTEMATQTNTNSTITQPQDWSQQTGNEHIQPSSENSMLKRFIEEKTITEENYMLNSITGDALSLEQYALNIDRPFMCTQCPKTYKDKTGLLKHLRLHETLTYKNLKRKLAIKKIRMNKDLGYKASVKITASEVKKEKIEGQQEYICSCGKSYSRKTRMESCWRSHNDVYEEIPNFKCVTCKISFSTNRKLIEHNRNLHVRKKFPCKFCPAEFHQRKHLVYHLTQHRKLHLAEYNVMSEFIKNKHKKIRCFICKKGYEEILDLKVHVSSSHSNKNKCVFCKESMMYSEFFGHAKTYHQDKFQPMHELHEAYYELTRAWQCEECLIQFFRADEYAMHRVEKHPNSVSNTSRETDQHQCNSCQRVFTSAKSLNSHSRIHHTVEEKEQTTGTNLICVYCRKVCTEETLEAHMRFHSTERKYACRYCDYRFATSEKRKNHIQIHTGKLKFICFICEYRCSSEHRLQIHKMSWKHQAVKENLMQGKALPNESSSRIEKVREDDKESNQSSSSSDSEAEDGYACDICGEKFSSNSKMMGHKQTHPFIEFPNEDTPTRIFFK